MNIVFFGSDDLAAFHLEKLIEADCRISACVTQPDRPKGRGLKMGISPVKIFAQKQDILLFQPENIKDEKLQTALKELKSDLFVVIAYGKILPQSLLDIPFLCCINVHASLLPEYRGAAPINWAIIKGEKKTGISIIRMNSVMDGGDIFFQAQLPIDSEDTSATLRTKLMSLGASCLCENIHKIKQQLSQAIPQDDKKVSFAPKMTKQLGHFSWDFSAAAIHNLVRGLVPWPSAYTYFSGKILKILETELEDNISLQAHGEIIDINKDGFHVSTGKGVILIKKVHLESSKAMHARSFLAGHKIRVGDRFS
ncbi:MAG: methionyl-tRNA formyltransferase [Candidatus Omnitrophica bacterium]|nr:methionyl-tRNA formyltransferase [Candidatus Omnitrophota bacterium]